MAPLRRSGFVALVGLLAACEFDSRAVAPTERKVIVHAVLNPHADMVKILVEELLTGRVNIDDDAPFREVDPIASGSGIPIAGCRVVLYNEAGDSAVAEESLNAGVSTGVYRLWNASPSPNAMVLMPGARYFLRVTTPSGVIVTGSTTIPEPTSGPTSSGRSFNRDNDTLRLNWPPASGAKTYLIRVNSPRGPYHMFTDSLNIRLPGSLRDFFSEMLPSVFVPGFTQTLLLSAVDTNFYDYYRTQNNPFTGMGLINHLQGGTGLFGSLVPLQTLSLSTIADQDEPIEGEYLAEIAFTSASPYRLSLFIESKRAGLAQITGNYDRQATFEGGGVIGFQQGSKVSLAFLRGVLAGDTLSTYSGTLFGNDSIVGTIPATGERIVYVKRP